MKIVLTLSALSFWLFQTVQDINFFAIVDKYGLPLAFLVAVSVYFRSREKRAENNADDYREAILSETSNQTQYLKQLLKEAQSQGTCKFEK